MEIIRDQAKISPDELGQSPHSSLLTLTESLEFLTSPDSCIPLRWNDCRTNLTDGVNFYPLRGELPILIPEKLCQYYGNKLQIPFNRYKDPFLQYFLLASIKQSGEINASSSEEPVHKHLYRMRNLLSDCSGIALDVGCDDPILGAKLFPKHAKYIGLDPFSACLSPFRIIGVAEYLPFAEESFDSVVFNTSLDHILDWRRALIQAKKVLKKNGSLYLSSYIWSEKADLITDSVHFHHFRLYELLGALDELKFSEIESCIYESPKGDTHRHGLYLKAYKK